MEDNKRKERQKEEEMENSDSGQLFSAVTTIVCPHSASCCQLTVTVLVLYINLFCNVYKMLAAFSDLGWKLASFWKRHEKNSNSINSSNSWMKATLISVKPFDTLELFFIFVVMTNVNFLRAQFVANLQILSSCYNCRLNKYKLRWTMKSFSFSKIKSSWSRRFST